MGTSASERCQKLSEERIPIRAYDTDKFNQGETTRIKALSGFSRYVWNDRDTTTTNEYELTLTGKYWVKVFDDALSCSSIVSDTIVFIETVDRMNIKASLEKYILRLQEELKSLQELFEECQATIKVMEQGTEQEEEKRILHIYPNPTNRDVTVVHNQIETGEKIRLYSISGTLMNTYEIIDAATTTIDVSSLPLGVYVIKAAGRTAKIVKE